MKKVPHLVGRALRETGQALDRLALTITGIESFRDPLSRHRTLMPLFDKAPSFASSPSSSYVAPTAAVIGDVRIGEKASIWYGAVVRANGEDFITIGANTNVQDRAVIGTAVVGVKGGTVEAAHTKLGANVTIGHGALLTSCVVGDDVLVGQGAIIGQGAEIGKLSMIAAGAVVLPGTKVPTGELWGGNPAIKMRDLTAADKASLSKSAEGYSVLAKEHFA